VRVEAVLDRRRRHVLALGRFEKLLGAAGDLEQPVGAALAAVAGVKETVLGERGRGEFGLLVVAAELRGT
jgi:hypothetical protein